MYVVYYTSMLSTAFHSHSKAAEVFIPPRSGGDGDEVEGGGDGVAVSE